MAGWRKIGREEDFRKGEGRSLNVGGRQVAVFREGAEWFAIEDACPHMRARLSEGTIRDCVVTCGWHGWRIDLRSGVALTRSRARVATCAVRVEDGQVWLGPWVKKESPPEPVSGGG
ncbi:MAG: Rieske 2Fe-2S domain-containing protein [Acidobacteria bacterium]|nr:Rieske 2Fe-2S domain-containing protein [Acidobacteriota bacterium]